MRDPYNRKKMKGGDGDYSEEENGEPDIPSKVPIKTRRRSVDPSKVSLMEDSVNPSHLYFEVFCYATEDLEKVKRSVLNIMPKDLKGSIEFDLSESKGYHGDLIVVMRGEIKESRSVKSFLENLSKSMDPGDKFLLSEKFVEYLDERGNLYLRISKQDAFLERLKIGEKDVIKIKVSFQAYGKSKLDKILEYCKKLGLIV
ncbi:MAG: RNA-binding domain-containing protein [Candidatus Asgardarchaeia archaeon]